MMIRRRFLSLIAASPLAGLMGAKAEPTMPRCVVENIPKLAEVLGVPSMHWATPHSTPLADMIAMRDRLRAASIGLQADPIAAQINEALEAQR